MGSRKQGDETNRQVLGVIKAHGQISTSEIAKILQRPDSSVRETCRRLQAKGYLHKVRVDSAAGRSSIWSLAAGPVDDSKHHRVRTPPSEPDNWKPQPWVHPIRARALGLFASAPS